MTARSKDLEIEKIKSSTNFISYFSYLNRNSLWNIYSYGLELGKSISQIFWANDTSTALAEDRFLRCLKHSYYRYYVEISNDCKIWTFSSVPYPHPNPAEINNSDRPVILMLHGFIAGLAFFAMNFDSIVDAGYDVYAIDLPGFARSSRIDFSENGCESEKIFVESIDKWRNLLGLKKLILVGHSFGGYLTCAYSLSYPQYVYHIVLTDPWGFPDLREEVTHVVETGTRSAISAPLLALPVWVRLIVMVLLPFSPFSFVRLTGKYFGPKIIHHLRPDMTRRYAPLFGDDDQDTVADYIFHTNKYKPTGEEAFRSMILPLAWAKRPMIKRIGEIDKNVKISFIYGSRSWIDYRTGFEVRNLRHESFVNVHIIEGAGHHLYADEPDRFNTLLLSIISGTSSTDLSFEESISSHLIRDNIVLD